MILLTISGVTSTFPTRKPSVEEYESCLQYELTFDSPDYDPHDPTYSRQENAAIETLLETGDRVRGLSKSLLLSRKAVDYDSRSTALLYDISLVLDDRSFLHDMENVKMISSVTALDIYGLSGQVPETMVSGETADISPFAAFKWYHWIMYRDTTSSFPEDKMVLGRDLGPAIDVGPAMTQKVLKSTGQTIYWSIV